MPVLESSRSAWIEFQEMRNKFGKSISRTSSGNRKETGPFGLSDPSTPSPTRRPSKSRALRSLRPVGRFNRKTHADLLVQKSKDKIRYLIDFRAKIADVAADLRFANIPLI